jgi:hypothetical protein
MACSGAEPSSLAQPPRIPPHQMISTEHDRSRVMTAKRDRWPTVRPSRQPIQAARWRPYRVTPRGSRLEGFAFGANGTGYGKILALPRR